MVVQDPEKNRAYVAKHRAMKKANEETKKQYNELNASYVKKFRDEEKQKLGEEEFKKRQAEYMRQYRAQKKEADKKSAAIIKIQNAIRNKNAIDKVATLYVDKQKQIQQQMLKANEVLSQINQEKKDKEILKNKINASVIANDMLNDLFPQILNTIPLKRNVGRPKLPRNPVGRPKKKI